MTQALAFLSLPPGDVVYHLAVLFAIEAMLAMTWHHRHDGLARRWALASAGLTAGRLLLILAAVLAALGALPSSVAITPPLERFIETAGLGLLAWAFVPWLQDHPVAGKALAIGNLIAAATLYAWAAPQWLAVSSQGVPFNLTAQNGIWSAWALALSLVAAILSLARRHEGWALSLVAFALLAAGHALHLVWPDPKVHAAEWARLGALVAFPLFAALVYEHMTAREAPAEQVSVAPHAGGPKRAPTDSSPAAEACRAVAEANDLPLALQRAASAIAGALQADLVAVGIPGASPDTVELTAVHHPGATPEVGATFPLDSQGAIQQAISHKREARLDPVQAQGNEAVTLALLLDTPLLRPLLIEPLVYNRETLGVLIVGEAQRKTAEPNDNSFGHAAQAAAAQLGWALGMARRAETLARRAEELAASLRHQETRILQNQVALEADAAQSQVELQAACAELEEARAQATHHQKRAEEIAALVDQMQMESGQIAQRDWKEQVERLRADRTVAVAEADNGRQGGPHEQVVATRQVTALTTPNGNPEESGNRSEVIASLSQELRTPMTLISGYTDLLLSESAGILGAMQRQFLQRVKANIERMSGMLNDLVRAAEIDTAHLELEAESVNLAEVVEEARLGSAAQFRERSISLQIDLAEPLPALHADRDSLYQILSHLLANACQCSKSGTQVRVSAQRSEAEGLVAVSVTDTGGGISPSDRQRVFSRHYRADNPLIEGLGDTSIGLSIAKTLVEAHSGRIWVDSEMGQGSTFTFVLRAVPPA